jgi:type II secretory pathway pseudopilin PulG
VSDAPQGPGWWQASDGRFYPLQPAAPPSAPPGPPAATSGKAKTALGLAISSFVVCPVVGAVASLFVAHGAQREIEASHGRLGGEGLVTTSRILSIVHLVGALVMVPLLLAIAIPTFLGARERAQDRAVQSNLRNALVAEKTRVVDTGAWTDDPSALRVLEPSLQFVPGERPSSGSASTITVLVDGPTLGLGARSESGTCFYLVDRLPASTSGGELDAVSYAQDDDCGPVQEQQLVTGWG